MATWSHFHSHGCTLTLWYPVIEGVRAVTQSKPVGIAKNAEIIERYGVTLLVTTPDFLRGYLERANAKPFKCVKILITGRESLPRKLGEAFNRQFDNDVFPA